MPATMHLSVAVRELHARRPFRMARGHRPALRNVFVRIEHDGIAGFGEASPVQDYGETGEPVAAKLAHGAALLKDGAPAGVADLEQLWLAAWPLLQPSRAAQCALDIALWDWLARRLGTSVAELAWQRPPQPV